MQAQRGRGFAIDVRRCPCGVDRKRIGVLSRAQSPDAFDYFLRAMGELTVPPPHAKARPPPQVDFDVPDVSAQIISQSADLPMELTELTIKAIADVAASQLGGFAGAALATLAIPFQQNLQQIAVQTGGGYLMVGTNAPRTNSSAQRRNQ